MATASAFDALPPLGFADQAVYREGLALRALAQSRAPGWIERCLAAALDAAHPFPRGEARIALQLAPAAQVIAGLLPPLASPNRRLRRRAMTLLPRLDAAELVRQLDTWLPSATTQGKQAACVILAAVAEPALPLLHRLSRDQEPTVRRRAARALQTIQERAAASPLRHLPQSPSARRPFGLQPPTQPPPPRPRSFAVAAFNFSYGVNLGVLIRSAEAAGAEAVWIVGRDFYYRPATKGADWWLPVELIDSPAACLDRAARDGFQIVALQQGERAQPLFDAPWPERPLIVVGNEGDGLPPAFLQAAHLQLAIPIHGRIDSLNVAVAASVAIYAYLAARAS